MNWRNVDPSAWLLCAQWVADVMNHTSEKSLNWKPPLQVLTGQIIDIASYYASYSGMWCVSPDAMTNITMDKLEARNLQRFEDVLWDLHGTLDMLSPSKFSLMTLERSRPDLDSDWLQMGRTTLSLMLRLEPFLKGHTFSRRKTKVVTT